MALNNSNNNNISNNNNNDHFTQLFYKVIHNKYIFDNIIQQIHSNEWVTYNKPNQIKYDNRIKFKDIQSVSWMIDNQQIELLKCKLDAGDPVHFEDVSLDYINDIQNENDRITVLQLILESTSIFNKDQAIFDGLHLLSPELLSIALNPPYSIPILESTIERSFTESTEEQINIIYNHLYNRLINNNNNNNNINNSSSYNQILKRTRDQYEQDNNNNNNSSNTINNIHTNNNNNNTSVNSNNSSNNNNNIQLYSLFIQSLFNHLLKIKKDIYKYDRILSNIFNNNSSINNSNNNNPTPPPPPIYSLISIPKLDIDIIIFKIISMATQIILLDNNLYSITNHLQQYNNDINNIIMDNNNNNNNNSHNSSHNKIINLRNYIKSKQQSITQDNNNKTFPILQPSSPSPSKSSSNDNSIQVLELKIYKSEINSSLHELNNLKLFLNNNKYNWKEFDLNKEYHSFGHQVNLDYIKYYIELENQEEFKYFRVGVIDNKINQDILKITFKYSYQLLDVQIIQEYINYAKSISNDNERASSIPMIKFMKGLTIQNGKLIIMDTETVDIYIYICNSTLGRNNHIQFNDIGILKHLKDKKKVSIYNCIKIISDSLTVGNIDQVIQVFDMFNNYLPFGLLEELFKYIENGSIGSNGINYSTKLQILNYFIKRKCSASVSYCLGLFINNDNSSSFIKNDVGYLLAPEYNTFRCKVLTDIIQHGEDSRILNLLFSNGINPIIDNYKELNQLKWVNQFYGATVLFTNQFKLIFNSSKDTFDHLFKIIQLLLDYCDIQISNMKNQLPQEEEQATIELEEHIGTCTSNHIKELFQGLLNHLFRRVITIKRITIEQAMAVYNLINHSRSARVDTNSTYLSIYYLSIKSIKLIKYIIGPPISIFYDNEYNREYILPTTNQISSFYGDDDYSYYEISCLELIDFRDYIDPSVFTFGFIFNNSFDTVLNQLINHWSYLEVDKLIQSNNDNNNNNESTDIIGDINESFNYNLEYLMDINRHDLVLQHLEIIKSKYSDHYNSTEFQLSSRFIEQCIHSDFITPLLDHSIKLFNFKTPPYKLLNNNIINQIINNIKNNNNNNDNHNNEIINNIINNNKPIIHQHDKLLNNNHYQIISSIDTNDIESIQSVIESPIHLPFKLYQEYLSLYPSHPFIRPSKTLLSAAIESRSYYFIKYLLDNQLINNNQHQDDQYNQLQSYLHQQLLLNNIEFNFN